MGDAVGTIGQCLGYARGRLPRLEADLLVSSSLGVPRSHLYAFEEQPVDPSAGTRLAAWIHRRAEGEPVAYILGRRGFWGLDFEVTPDVLVPRPDTETLVEAALPLVADEASVLDVGTGCGNVVLALASERPRAQFTATDIDPACIALCRRNAARLGLAVTTRIADGLDGLDGPFDVVVGNPPYVDDADARLGQGDLRFEPRRALVGGPNGGLDVIARLIRNAPDRLATGGWLCLEHGDEQGDEAASLFEDRGFVDIRGHMDFADRPRVTVGRWNGGTS